MIPVYLTQKIQEIQLTNYPLYHLSDFIRLVQGIILL